MRYKILHSGSIIDEVSGKQTLYTRWENLVNDYRSKGLFDCCAGFVMWLRDTSEVKVVDIHEKTPRYDRNEWKNH